MRTLIPTPPRTVRPSRSAGVVTWYCRRRRIGFIAPADDGEPFYFHASDVSGASPDIRLAEGQRVSYAERHGGFGLRAVDVALEAA